VWSGSEGQALTISDLAARLYDVFFLPGDSLLWLALNHAPRLATFLELVERHDPHGKFANDFTRRLLGRRA
jgi:hypothetical protein